ncbi:hypothetical protein [Sphingomonas zeicaulis]|uniref:hypothetical protein n=1 Tax=Sphingomonas zeicaulis TaxID=1632740 RepID=UPI003D1B7BEF
MATLPELARRLNRAIEANRGIRFEYDDLALLAAIGVNELIQVENAKFQREQCLKRANKALPNPSFTAEDDIGLPGIVSEMEPSAPRSCRSSGMTRPQDVTAAAARVQRVLRTRRTNSTSSTSKGNVGKPSAERAGSPSGQAKTNS